MAATAERELAAGRARTHGNRELGQGVGRKPGGKPGRGGAPEGQGKGRQHKRQVVAEWGIGELAGSGCGTTGAERRALQ